MPESDPTPADRTALDPAALSLTDAARVLSAAKNGKVTVDMLQADVQAGAPTNTDGTLNLVHYARRLARIFQGLIGAWPHLRHGASRDVMGVVGRRRR